MAVQGILLEQPPPPPTSFGCIPTASGMDLPLLPGLWLYPCPWPQLQRAPGRAHNPSGTPLTSQPSPPVAAAEASKCPTLPPCESTPAAAVSTHSCSHWGRARLTLLPRGTEHRATAATRAASPTKRDNRR